MAKMKMWNDCTHAEKIARWENAERVLRSMTPHERRKHWNMACYGVQTQCGTVVCAAGKCGEDSWFNKRGFKLKPVTLEYIVKDSYNSYYSYRSITDIDPLSMAVKGYGAFENDVTVDEFFGYRGSVAIFYNPALRPVSTVIKEIQHYIRFLKLVPRLTTLRNVGLHGDARYTQDDIENGYNRYATYRSVRSSV